VSTGRPGTDPPGPEVLAAFGLGGAVVASQPLGGGHIHGTWRVRTAGGDDVVCQALNGLVFRDLDAVERNLDRIDAHLADRGLVARLRRTAAGRPHAVDAEGRTWRVSDFVVGSRPARGAAEPGAVAFAFGQFIRALMDLPGGPLLVTIPGFHDLALREAAFETAVASDRLDRLRGCADVVARARRLLAEPGVAADRSGLSTRTVHNDAKVDNLLVDAAGRPLAVVDLDTVMPGSPLDDLGELLRTGTTDAAEDEPDPSRIAFDDAAAATIVEGFAEGAGPALDPAARALIPTAGPRMAVENAVRFLADHLDGDRYFAIIGPGQNLDRARAQLRVAELLLAWPGGGRL
jgi:aminoglycoside phosphotransferase (APT) family kinase protein